MKRKSTNKQGKKTLEILKGQDALGSSVAQDYFRNSMARMGYGTPSLAEATEYQLDRLSNNYWLMITLYRNHWISRRIVDLPAQDMTRAWCHLTSELEPKDIQRFDRAVDRTFTPARIEQALKWARLFGGAGCLICIKGHEDHLDEPLDLDDINPGSYLGLIPFDRWSGIWPSGEISQDLERPLDWGLPKSYQVTPPQGTETFNVHSSRILRFIGPEVPKPEFQAQLYWGISVLEVVFEELKKRDNASWAILQLLFRAQILAQRNPDLASLLSGVGAGGRALQMFEATMEAQNKLLSNQSMLILGKDGELSAHQYTFSGIGEVYAQFQMDTAGAAEIPVTRLFGRTITGLGQSNDADERQYEERIAHEQTDNLKPQLTGKLYPVICMSELGEIPDDLDIKFPSVRVLTEEDRGDITDKASAPVIAAFNAGIIGRKTTMQELKELSDTTGVFTNITDEQIQEAEDEPELPGEGMFGEESGEAGQGGSGPPKPEGFSRPNPRRQLKEESGGAMDARSIAKRITWHGLDVSIENPAGSIREGIDSGGNHWKVKLTHDYGYLRKTQGVDGDHVDCFIGPHRDADKVYVVHTRKAPDFTEYDEDKCFLDFESETEARSAFMANYDRPEHFGSMHTLTVGDFIDKVLATKEQPNQITNDGHV